MARYIDADRLKEAFSTDTQHLSTFDPDLYDLIVLDIEEAPTADVVEVVRCGNCKHGEDYNDRILCNKNAHIFGKNDFCSYGQRTPQKEG